MIAAASATTEVWTASPLCKALHGEIALQSFVMQSPPSRRFCKASRLNQRAAVWAAVQVSSGWSSEDNLCRISAVYSAVEALRTAQHGLRWSYLQYAPFAHWTRVGWFKGGDKTAVLSLNMLASLWSPHEILWLGLALALHQLRHLF